MKPWPRGRWTGFPLLLLLALLVLFLGEERLVTNPCRGPSNTGAKTPSSVPSWQDEIQIRAPMSLEAAFAGKRLDVKQVSEQVPRGIRTEFEPNRNAGGYGLSVVRNVCFLPNGPIVLVNITEDELHQTLSASPTLRSIWEAGYNTSCTWCTTTGSRIYAEPPEDARWIRGNTTHLLPYLGNVFHNFAERVWPTLLSYQSPLNRTSMQPINHFLLYRFVDWLEQAEQGNHERETFMLQFRVLAELSPGSDFVVFERGGPPACFERLTLDCSSCDRMSERASDPVARSLAVDSYRKAAYNFFRVPQPAVVSPPRRLRVGLYGRSDTKRRRVVNVPELASRLRSWRQPRLELLVIDDLLTRRQYNQTMAETVSLFSQLDVFITVHGANTWAVLFMPRRSAVIEIYGPCGPGTWIDWTTKILAIKHDVGSNPWRDRVASPLAGNTTNCEQSYKTPDFTIDADKLESTVKQLSLPSGPGDELTLHWLYDWKQLDS